jgi:hypothetical protein
LLYGYDAIARHWLDALRGKELVEGLLDAS